MLLAKQKRKPLGAAAVVHKKQKSKLAAKNKTKRLTTAFPDSVLRMRPLRPLKAKLKKIKQRQKIKENPVALELELRYDFQVGLMISSN